MNIENKSKVVVLSCMGGSQGDLSVVRALGRCGVHVVVFSEYDTPIAKYSKYTKEFYKVPPFSQNYMVIRKYLVDYARKQDKKPVLFPTADPDLKMISELREELGKYFSLFISSKEIIDGFMDKGKFFEYSNKYNFPVPYTKIPKNQDDVVAISEEIGFPVIMKPIFPHSWMNSNIQKIVEHKKAVKINDKNQLVDMYASISKYNNEMVIQEYVPGRDDHLYSLHIYMDRNKKPAGCFTGQKIRTYPIYAGIGCFVKSVYVPQIISAGTEMLQKVGYTGLALMQFKKDPRDDKFKLIEVNPRASSWNLLAASCGVNLPYLAYLDAIGEPLSKINKQTENTKYVFFEHDLSAFLDYRKHGELTIYSWLNSYRGKKVYQYFSLDDMGPFWRSTRLLLGRYIAKILRLK